MVNDELGKIWKEAVVASKRHNGGACLDELRTTTKGVSESQCTGQVLNPGTPKHQVTVSVSALRA